MGARRIGSSYVEDASATTSRTIAKPFVEPGTWIVLFTNANNNPTAAITAMPNGFSQFGSRVQDGSNTVLDVLVRYIPDQTTADAVNNGTGADATWTLTHDIATKGQHFTFAYTGLKAAAMFVNATGSSESGTSSTAHSTNSVTTTVGQRLLSVFCDRLTAGVTYTQTGSTDAMLLNKMGAFGSSNIMNSAVLESDILTPGTYSRSVSLSNISDAAVQWIAALNVDTTAGFPKSDTGRTIATQYVGDGGTGLSSWTLAVPEELMIGDLIHAYYVANASAADTITPPAGTWTAIVPSSLTGAVGYAWYAHTVTQAEVEAQKAATGPVWTFTTSVARTGNWVTERIRDYDRSGAYDGSVSTVVSGTTSTNVPSITTTGTNRLLVGYGNLQSASGQSIAVPSGWTQLITTCLLSLGRGQTLGNFQFATAGATGIMNWVKTSALSGSAAVIAVKPEVFTVPGVLQASPTKLKYWNGSQWVVVNKLKYWNGSAWRLPKRKAYT